MDLEVVFLDYFFIGWKLCLGFFGILEFSGNVVVVVVGEKGNEGHRLCLVTMGVQLVVGGRLFDFGLWLYLLS